MLVPNSAVGLAGIYTASHLVGAFLRHGQERQPEAAGLPRGLRW